MFTGSVNIGLAIWLGVLGILAYANYRVPEPSPRRAWLHTGIVLATPAVLLTAFCMVLLPLSFLIPCSGGARLCRFCGQPQHAGT